MKYSYKLSDAIHILAYLAIFGDGDRSSKAIAASIEANPSVVRALMADLKRAGLIESRPGAADPTLTREPAQINLLEVYRALAINHDLLHVDPKTTPACPVGANIQQSLDEVYAKVQQAAETQLAETSLAEVVEGIRTRAKLTD